MLTILFFVVFSLLCTSFFLSIAPWLDTTLAPKYRTHQGSTADSFLAHF
jgi:lipopolysaccharide assembly outer membrane protein LptD (OstA)